MLDRAKLRQMMHKHPEWSNRQYAQILGRSRKWVQKWKQRLQAAASNDQDILRSQSRARKTPPEPYHPDVIGRILELRDHPPEAGRTDDPLLSPHGCGVTGAWTPLTALHQHHLENP